MYYGYKTYTWSLLGLALSKSLALLATWCLTARVFHCNCNDTSDEFSNMACIRIIQMHVAISDIDNK